MEWRICRGKRQLAEWRSLLETKQKQDDALDLVSLPQARLPFSLLTSRYTSTDIATAPPPPRHSVASPRPPPRLRSSWISVIRTREPLEPMGCPSAIAPPFTFTRDQSQSSSLPFASACAANASFTSIRSKSPIRKPVRSKSRFTAIVGAAKM